MFSAGSVVIAADNIAGDTEQGGNKTLVLIIPVDILEISPGNVGSSMVSIGSNVDLSRYCLG